jgi:hypothetical protein
MRYKELVTKKLNELIMMLAYQNTAISQLRPALELKNTLDMMRAKIDEIQHLINTEQES